MWPVLERKACATPAVSIPILKKRLVKAWTKIDQKIIHFTLNDFPHRLTLLQKVIIFNKH